MKTFNELSPEEKEIIQKGINRWKLKPDIQRHLKISVGQSLDSMHEVIELVIKDVWLKAKEYYEKTDRINS